MENGCYHAPGTCTCYQLPALPVSKVADYHVGDPWFSYDSGKTWTRHSIRPDKPTGKMTIVKVDHLLGQITVEVG